MNRRWPSLIVVFLACGASLAAAGQPGSTPRTSTLPRLVDVAAKGVQANFPGSSIIPVDELNFKIKAPTRETSFEINIGALAKACRSAPEGCRQALTHFVKAISESVDQPVASVRVQDLRVVVRAAAQLTAFAARVATMQGQSVPGQPVSKLVTESLIEGLGVAVVVDGPRAMRYLLTADLKGLKMSPRQALDAAKANTEGHLGEIVGQLQPIPGSPLLGSPEGAYASSRVVAHGSWAAMAAKMKGDLRVAIPSPEIVMVTDGGVPGAAAVIHKIAALIYEDKPRPIFKGVLRWTPKGWVVVR